MIRVVIADDHHLVRQGIRALLDLKTDILVVGEAHNGLEALQKVLKYVPDVLVLDINMPELSGIEVTRIIHDWKLPTQVLILSMYSDESIIKQAFKNGACGYILKRSVTEELLDGIHAASKREYYVSPSLASLIDAQLLNNHGIQEILTPYDSLSSREREVLALIAGGYTNYAMAQKLNISVKTIEKHRSNLMRKLDIHDVAGLVREALKHGLVFL